MATATKITITFDDGSTYVVDAAKVGSLYTSEAKAKKCGHNPPYGKPPKSGSSTTAAADSTSTAAAADTTSSATVMEGSCYLINGVIICP